MARTMRLTAILSLAGTLLLSVLYRATSGGVWLSLAITCGTVAYHIIMRLLVGLAFSAGMQNRANYTSRWYQVSRREMAVYEKLKVKRWKRGMPTYDPSLFDPRTHTWEEIVQATCQAELVHETIAVLSFLPIAAGVRFGAYPVFIITSVLAAACDMAFVIMQRYNRPRLINKADGAAEAQSADGRVGDGVPDVPLRRGGRLCSPCATALWHFNTKRA